MPHPIHGHEAMPESKLALFWLIGGLLILFGGWIAGKVEWVLGTTALGYWGALIVAAIMILLGGLAWIAVAVSVAHHR